MARPRVHTDELRERLVEHATHLLATEGRTFALRPLAEQLGTSTTAVYSLFGSRGALIDEVANRAIADFTGVIAQCDSPDPLANLLDIAMKYRDLAQDGPALFAAVIGETSQSDEALAARMEALGPVKKQIEKAIADGLLEGTVDDITRAYVAAGHGFITLEPLRLMSGEDAYRSVVVAALRSFATDRGRDALAALEQR